MLILGASIMRKKGSITRDDFYSWGYNSYYTLGDGTTVDRSSPISISAFSNLVYNSWKVISTGGSHTAALDAKGRLYVWGDNSWGQHGRGSTTRTGAVYQHSNSWISVSAGSLHTHAVKSDGTLWGWGLNGGALGNGSTLNNVVTSPQIIKPDLNDNWVSVSAGPNYSVGLRGTPGSGAYSLWVWGNSVFTGLNDTVRRSFPVQNGANNQWSAVYVFSGVYAVSNTGNLYVWGYNGDGVLGLGDTIDRSSPVLLMTNQANVKIDNGGGGHAALIKNDGSLWMVGNSQYGQNGIDFVNRSSFVQVGASSWTAVSTGGQFTTAIDAGGRLFAWGRNLYGALGGPDPNLVTQVNSPVQIGSISSWSMVSSGGNFFSHAVIRTDI